MYAKCICVIMTYEVSCTPNGLFAIFFWPWFWYFVTKLFWPNVRKNCSSDCEKLLKFEAEGQDFAKSLRSLEQFIQTVKDQNNFW
jgi:hypothetical protein